MKLTIIGHGYVGLVTAAVFADLGNTVWVIGRNQEKINQLNSGKPTFYEPGLEEMLTRNVKSGRLVFTLDYKQGIPQSDIVFICVGTPSKTNGEADLTSVLAVAKEIGSYIHKYIVIACKSTVPIGTNRIIKDLLLKDCGVDEKKFDIASCPEFLREGSALSDTLHPDRIVVGTENKKACDILVKFHEPIGAPFVLTNIETAEMIKYASNSLLATKISFANMIAFLCDKVGADAEAVLDGVGMDKRLGRRFLNPGAGYGGSCFPKDVKALIKIGQKQSVDMGLLENVEKINETAYKNIVDKILQNLGEKVDNKTVAVLGLAFKPDTDDMREAPSIKIITALRSRHPNLKIKAYDPIVKHLDDKLFHDMIYSSSAYDAAKDADICIIVTEWNEFRQLDLTKLKESMKNPILIDGRNIFTPEQARAAGFIYSGSGRN